MDWSSTTAELLDRSGNGNHGDAQGGMSATTSPTEGVLGQGMGFDGVDDSIAIQDEGSAPELDLSVYTLATWIRVGTWPSSSYATFINKTNNYYFELVPGGNLGSGLYNDPDGWISHETSGLNLIAGTWYNAVATYDGSRYKLYIDGIEVLNDAESRQPVLTDHNLDVGCAGAGFCEVQYFDGSLDDVRIYNRALSADEVKRLYELGQ